MAATNVKSTKGIKRIPVTTIINFFSRRRKIIMCLFGYFANFKIILYCMNNTTNHITEYMEMKRKHILYLNILIQLFFIWFTSFRILFSPVMFCIVHVVFFFPFFSLTLLGRFYFYGSAVGVRSDRWNGTKKNSLWRARIFHSCLPPLVSSPFGNFLTILVISISGNYSLQSKEYAYNFIFILN